MEKEMLDRVKQKTKDKISVSKFQDIEIDSNTRKFSKNGFLKIAVLILVVTIFPLGFSAAKIEIKYDPISGKPIIIAGQPAPEELKEKEVVIAVPENVKKNEYIKNIKEILVKYYDEEEVIKICGEAQKVDPKGNGNILTKEGGIKFYNLIAKIIEDGKITEVDKNNVLDYIQCLDDSAIDLNDVDEKVLEIIFPVPEAEISNPFWKENDNIYIEGKKAEIEINMSFTDILYKYYDKAEIDNILENVSLEHNSESKKCGEKEFSIKIIEYMLTLLEREELSNEEKSILKYRASETYQIFEIEDEELKNRIEKAL